jgi:hypothetical protein
MNREWVLYHLRQAHQELARTITGIDSDLEYDVEEFGVALAHVYHHVNTAWNSRDQPGARVRECTDADFSQWRQFPSDVFLCP